MAVKNSLTKASENPSQVIRYMAGENEVKLSPAMVRDYLVSGDASNVTQQEIVMFINLCKYQGLNPFLREAYLIKYGSKPAQLITGKTALEKRAARCSKYKGFKAGIIVWNENSGLEYREGTLKLENEKLVGGWAEIYVDGFDFPVKAEVSLDEYIGRKQDGAVNSQWSTKPATMIRKVAKMQALREAFPEDLEGMYSAEEMNVEEPAEAPIVFDAEEIIEEKQPETLAEYEPPADEFAELLGE